MVGGPPTPRWLVLGAGGHARVVADVIARLGGTVAAVAGAPSGPPWSVPLLPSDDEALGYAVEHRLLVALGVGANAARMPLLSLVTAAGLLAPPLLAATSTVAVDARLGDGTAVLEHAHVGPVARVGPAVIVNTAAVIEHDCVVGEGAHLAPGAILLGAAQVGARSLVGSGARVLPGVAVGADCVVGAGAVVREDVPDGTMVAGVPATPVGR
jgi:sugar O-acyltransferase (sialic acid O-acetyltransferase NeuD family)